MTNKEAIKGLKKLRSFHNGSYGEHIDMAIKALNQGDVLGKIRAEIFKEVINYSGTGEEVIQAYDDGLKKGLDIIDMYREGGAE